MAARKGDGQLGELRCDCHDCPCPDGNHAKEEKRPCEAPSEAEIVPRPAFLRERKNTRSLHHHRLERRRIGGVVLGDDGWPRRSCFIGIRTFGGVLERPQQLGDRKSTRLNSSHYCATRM